MTSEVRSKCLLFQLLHCTRKTCDKRSYGREHNAMLKKQVGNVQKPKPSGLSFSQNNRSYPEHADCHIMFHLLMSQRHNHAIICKSKTHTCRSTDHGMSSPTKLAMSGKVEMKITVDFMVGDCCYSLIAVTTSNKNLFIEE